MSGVTGSGGKLKANRLRGGGRDREDISFREGQKNRRNQEGQKENQAKLSEWKLSSLF